jgi:hypothetical protein
MLVAASKMVFRVGHGAVHGGSCFVSMAGDAMLEVLRISCSQCSEAQ